MIARHKSILTILIALCFIFSCFMASYAYALSWGASISKYYNDSTHLTYTMKSGLAKSGTNVLGHGSTTPSRTVQAGAIAEEGTLYWRNPSVGQYQAQATGSQVNSNQVIGGTSYVLTLSNSDSGRNSHFYKMETHHAVRNPLTLSRDDYYTSHIAEVL